MADNKYKQTKEHNQIKANSPCNTEGCHQILFRKNTDEHMLKHHFRNALCAGHRQHVHRDTDRCLEPDNIPHGKTLQSQSAVYHISEQKALSLCRKVPIATAAIILLWFRKKQTVS